MKVNSLPAGSSKDRASPMLPSNHKEASAFANKKSHGKLNIITRFKNLTIKIHEAKLMIDVSVFGKMAAFCKVKIGKMVWQTSVDNSNHMNPKWNESKTFDLSDNKVFKQLSLDQSKTSRASSPVSVKEDLGLIKITLKHNSFFQDTAIGKLKVKLDTILRTKSTSEWFVVQSKNDKEIVGQLLITFNLETNEDDSFTQPNISVMKTNDTKSYANYGDSRVFNTEPAAYYENSSRVQTEGNAYPSSLKTSANKKLHYAGYTHERSFHSPYLGNSTRAFIEKGDQMSKQVSIDGIYTSQQRTTLNRRQHDNESMRKKDEHTNSMIIMKAPGIGSKPINDEKEPLSGNTLMTYYEPDSLNEEMSRDGRLNFDNYSKGKSNGSDLPRFEIEGDEDDDVDDGLADSDGTECDIDADQFDEGYKRIRTFEYNSDTYDDVGEMQKILESIKKDNIDIKTKENDLKQKFENLRVEYEKMVKEKHNLEAKQHALDLREDCLKNERKNLLLESTNLKTEQEEFKSHVNELDDLSEDYAQMLELEKCEKAQTNMLAEKIKQESQFIQKENQNLRSLENKMYKTKIENKIVEFTEELQEMEHKNELTPMHPPTNQGEKRHILTKYNLEDKCNLDVLLILFRKQSARLEDEQRVKLARISHLKDSIVTIKEISNV
jgi:hypothetical protein